MGSRWRELYRDNRALIWLCAVIFVTQLGFGGIVPVVPLYAREFGVSQTAIGLTIAVFGLARFLVSVPTGQLADRLGRRWTLVLGEAVTAVGNLLCGLSTTYEQFLVSRFIAGAGSSMVLTSGQVSLVDLASPANRGRVMGVYQGVFLFAVGFGPLPGGLLAEHILPQAGDEGDVRAEAGGGHGLVGALAAEGLEEIAAQHGLARRGQAGALDDQVDVGTADDGHDAHGFPLARPAAATKERNTVAPRQGSG